MNQIAKAWLDLTRFLDEDGTQKTKPVTFQATLTAITRQPGIILAETPEM